MGNPLRGRAYILFTDNGKTHVRYTDTFPGGMHPGSGSLEWLIKTLFDVQDEDDFVFKMQVYNRRFYGMRDFKVHTKGFYEFFNYADTDEGELPLGSLSDGNLDVRDISVDFDSGYPWDQTELFLLMNFSNKSLYLEANGQASMAKLPKWGTEIRGFDEKPGNQRRICAVNSGIYPAGRRYHTVMLDSMSAALTFNRMWGEKMDWDLLSKETL